MAHRQNESPSGYDNFSYCSAELPSRERISQLESIIRLLKQQRASQSEIREKATELVALKESLGYKGHTKKIKEKRNHSEKTATAVKGDKTETESLLASKLSLELAQTYIVPNSYSTEAVEVPRPFLSDVQRQEFAQQGMIVLKNIFTLGDISEAREGLHETLRENGVDVNNLEATAGNLRQLSSTGGAGGIVDIFYAPWKLKLMENPRLFAAISDIWNMTYASAKEDDFFQPFGPFNSNEGYFYIDRVCFRVPDAISQKFSKGGSKKSLQRSLTPHFDCCPYNMFGDSKKKPPPRWRPIQCFVALTDCERPNTGGFETVPGFHREFKSHFGLRRDFTPHEDAVGKTPETINRPHAVCVGDFSPLRPKVDGCLLSRFTPISLAAGDVIIWDYKLPHANSYRHEGTIPREVVYLGFLPPTEANRRYAEEQLRRYRAGFVPSDHWQEGSGAKQRKQPTGYQFSSLGAKLMGIIPWSDERSQQTKPSDKKA